MHIYKDTPSLHPLRPHRLWQRWEPPLQQPDHLGIKPLLLPVVVH